MGSKLAAALLALLLGIVPALAQQPGAPLATSGKPGSGGGGSGTVTSVSVVTANGFSGTVANPTTTPAITLTASGLALSVLATQSADTLVGNFTGSSASPTAGALLSCSTASSALTYNTSTHAFGCNSITGGGNVTVGTTTITSGTTTRVLFDNAGVLGEYVISGSGNVCMTTSCVMTTPNLGTPSAATLTNATGLPLSGLATQAADTAVVNATGGSASPTAVSIGSCSAATSALTYNTSTHAFGCNTISGASTSAVNNWTATQRSASVSITISTSTFTPDGSTGNNMNFTLVHASCPCTLANPTNVEVGASGVIQITQSSTGSDTIGTYGTDYKFPGGVKPQLSTAANAVDAISYYVFDATHILIQQLGAGFQ